MPGAFSDFKELYDDKAGFTDLIEHTERYAQILTVIEIAVLALYVLLTPTAGLLLSGSSVSLWFYIYLVLGLLMPLGLSVYNFRRVNPGGSSLVLSALRGNLMVLLGGLLLRYVVLIGGQLIY